MVYIKKKERESDDGLIRRFSRKMQQTGILRHVRATRFHRRPVGKETLRSTAMYKGRMSTGVERLKKMGHYNPDAIRELRKQIKKTDQ